MPKATHFSARPLSPCNLTVEVRQIGLHYTDRISKRDQLLVNISYFSLIGSDLRKNSRLIPGQYSKLLIDPVHFRIEIIIEETYLCVSQNRQIKRTPCRTIHHPGRLT